MVAGPKRRLAYLAAAALLVGAGPAAADEPCAPLEAPPQNLASVDALELDKSDRCLTLLEDGAPVRRYRVSLGFGGLAPKEREGDGRVPEGSYTISGRNPESAYHLSLRISYPDEADIARARAGGYDPGGDIMIHGLANRFGWLGALHRRTDWTAGCIAVTNGEIEEIWALVPDGTPIDIRP